MRFASVPAARTDEFSNSENSVSYKWNVDERQLPLLALPEHLAAGLERSLTYPLDQFRLPIFEASKYDDEHGRLLLPLISQANTGIHFIEFQTLNESEHVHFNRWQSYRGRADDSSGLRAVIRLLDFSGLARNGGLPQVL
ncbi:MAG TPA: hypothetical protein VLQ90_01605 [Pyrinomonadaceae bacterium]|nr:hypothetical protein [Pyrinomonadaceae bacterium]